MIRQIKKLQIFCRPNNLRAVKWQRKIARWLEQNYPAIKTSAQKPDAVIVLGGDGTILEAARKYQKDQPFILGLNLGRIGFLASVREEKKFLPSLKKFLEGKFWVTKRMMLKIDVFRSGKKIFSADVFNEVVVQSLLSMVEIEVRVEDHLLQYIRGTGVLVATTTGSTAYNLSAHGPIVMPDINCMIITEILDHNLPTPSIVINYDKKVTLKVLDFRKSDRLCVRDNKKPVDVIMASDGEAGVILPLQKNDVIKITKSDRSVRFIEFEKHYFLKSLQEKFAFK